MLIDFHSVSIVHSLTFSGSLLLLFLEGDQQTTTTITIAIERRHRSMALECVVQNPRIPSSTISDHILVDVQCKCIQWIVSMQHDDEIQFDAPKQVKPSAVDCFQIEHTRQ